MSDTGKTIALIKALSGAGGSLPPITDADNGKVLTANSGVWGAQEPIGKKFIVTLTPTAPDLSGTMDKTPKEITDAYNAGKEIWFKIYESETFYYSIKSTFNGKSASEEYYSFGAVFIYDAQYEVEIYTNSDVSAYSTTLYTLTPTT